MYRGCRPRVVAAGVALVGAWLWLLYELSWRVWYDSDTDTLVAAEEGVDEQGRPDMRHIGRVLVCKGYLAGNRDAVSFRSGADREAACVAAAGDYAFTGGWKGRGRIWINRLSDGEEGAVVASDQRVSVNSR